MNAPYTPAPTPDVLHAAFLAIQPRIQLHAEVSFRGLKCPEARSDAVAETVALAWKWFARMAQKGKDATRFPTALATFAARAVQCGRRLCGQERARDVLSPRAQQRHGFQVEPLPTSTRSPRERRSAPGGQKEQDAYEERLADNTRTPPAEQAAFRIDFRDWLATRTERDRRILQDMAVGERTGELAKKYGFSQGRVSQKRREFHADWMKFCGELPDGQVPAVACRPALPTPLPPPRGRRRPRRFRAPASPVLLAPATGRRSSDARLHPH
jgi:hypothetical protein